MNLKLPHTYDLSFEKKVNYKFSSEKIGKVKLRNILTEKSNGYCMYCYSKYLIDGKNFGHLEHTIEQDTIKELSNCHHNISIACPKCNLSFKKENQAERKINLVKKIKCDSLSCGNTPCDDYFFVADKYLENIQNVGKEFIIIKPRGVLEGPDKTERKYLRLVYDLLDLKFKVDPDISYTDKTKKQINKHIKKFRLNHMEYQTKEIFKVIEDIQAFKTLPNKQRYNNLVCDLFIEYLETKTVSLNSDKKIEKIEKICKIILSKNLLQFKK